MKSIRKLVILICTFLAVAASADAQSSPTLTPPTLSPPTLIGSPGLNPELNRKAPEPKVQTFTLARPRPMTAQVQLYIAATPSPTQQLLQLRRKAASLLSQIKRENYQVSYEGLTTFLSLVIPELRGTPSTDAEDHLREARRLLGEYLLVLRDIDWIVLGSRIGGENYNQRVAQVQIVQGRIDAVNVDLNPLYTVHRNNATVHIEDPNPPPNCRTETVYEAHIVNVTVQVGFDDRGNPIKRQGMDVVRTPKEITVCN